ncbi:putative ribonuclease H-like domain-containing protein [Tanacetum coccineum]
MRINHQNFSSSRRNFVPTAVMTKTGQVPISTGKSVNTACSKTSLNNGKSKQNIFQMPYSSSKRPFNKQIAFKYKKVNKTVNSARTNLVNYGSTKDMPNAVGKAGDNAVKHAQEFLIHRATRFFREALIPAVGERPAWSRALLTYLLWGEFDPSGCSRHMTGNKSYLTDYEDHDGGFVAFVGSTKGGKITGKGKIKTEHLDFEDVYFVKELKFNLFSVSQMCDRKNSVLFTETECLILSPEFKLPDENQVMLKIPRKDNMYSFNLKNIVPSKGLTCLIAKATTDESNMWHRRLGHINFKRMNKLVKGNLVRGLPSKIFENDHTCVACQKGKQHKASCRTNLVSSISKPLQILHMDLFGPTFVKSLMGKMYCLVITDDYSRFSWVFFLAKKDETSAVLKTFITRIENQLNHKVKAIRCDNGTEFKNFEMNQFCRINGIKREFCNARTPQQNGVAKRKNMTLIEAARTMLADSLLPIPFWAEAINTACYIQNRVLVTKPHNKTPYELLLRRPPTASFMRPFGCPVTILNTLDHLGKFDGKADEGFLVGYSINSKAFRVYNNRTRKVEENLHVNFLENKENVAGSGPEWLFDIDILSKSMNYHPVNAGNRFNGNAGLERTYDAGKVDKVKIPNQEYILLPLLHTNSHASSSDEDDDSSSKSDDGMKHAAENQARASEANNSGEDTHVNKTNRTNPGSVPVNSGCSSNPSLPNENQEGQNEQRNDYWHEQENEDYNSYRITTPINVAGPSNTDDSYISDLEDTLNL